LRTKTTEILLGKSVGYSQSTIDNHNLKKDDYQIRRVYDGENGNTEIANPFTEES